MSDTHPPRRRYAGHSDEERARERRERFLAAGFDLFGRLGYHGTTVRALCRSARLTERYFYQAFVDTEDLFCTVYQQHLDAVRMTFVTGVAHWPRELEPRVRAVLETYFTLMQDERRVRILFLEPLASTPKAQSMFRDNLRMTAMVSGQLLQSDHPQAQVDASVAAGVGLALSGACSALAVEWMLGGYATPRNTVVDAAFQVLFGTLRWINRAPPA